MLRDKVPPKRASQPAAFPPALAAAWGLTEPAGRGPRPGMSVPTIVRAAVELADADGIAAVSMSRVAARLGYTTMSLYRYVASKDDLVTLMFDAVLDPLPVRRRRRGWRAGIERWARELMDVYAQHEWLVDVPITGPPALPNQLAWLDWGLAELEPTGLPAAERLSVMLLVSGYVRNAAQLRRDILSEYRRAGSSPAEVGGRYQELLEQLVTEARFPALHDALHAGLLTDGTEDDDLEFEFGLQRILDGVDALVTSRRR
jgi:AcrR family transcriptional regulator